MSSSVIICVLCLEAIVEVTNLCDRSHALCSGCTTIFEGCPACNDYTMRPFRKSTVLQGDTKQTAIEVIDIDDDDDQKVNKPSDEVAEAAGEQQRQLRVMFAHVRSLQTTIDLNYNSVNELK